MRNNQPVTQNEIHLTAESLIVSKTDLKGQITYLNKDFISISGFTEAELIGQPHNIVRHPDMPVEAFEDMWRDLKDGRPWTGLVKNRCKNGDFYWVLATATPMRENGQVVGYMSVRRQATRQQIETAENAYQLFREKRAGGLKIRHGAVVRGSAGMFAGLSLRQKLYAGFFALLAMMVLVAGLGIWGINSTQAKSKQLDEQGVQPTQLLSVIGRLMAENRSQVLLTLQHDPAGRYAELHDHKVEFHTDQIVANIAEINAKWDAYVKTLTGEAEQKLAAEYTEARTHYVKDGLLPAREALLEGRYDDANMILLKTINPAYMAAASRANDLYQLQADRAHRLVAEGEQHYVKMLSWVLGLLLLAVVGGLWIASAIARSVTRPVDDIIATFQSLAKGDFTRNVDIAVTMKWVRYCRACNRCRFSRVSMLPKLSALLMTICESRLHSIA
jgi:methyl-accepting chemotaxis protein